MDQQNNKPKHLKFIDIEIQHINDEKYFEGERIKTDPGERFISDWVFHHAKDYRDAWEKSKCSSCLYWKLCGKEVKIFCERYKPLEV